MSETSQNRPFWLAGETIYAPQLAVEIFVQNKQRVATVISPLFSTTFFSVGKGL